MCLSRSQGARPAEPRQPRPEACCKPEQRAGAFRVRLGRVSGETLGKGPCLRLPRGSFPGLWLPCPPLGKVLSTAPRRA